MTKKERLMRLRIAIVAIVGISAIVLPVLASPAIAKGAKAQTIAKEQRHVQRHATQRSPNANATMRSGGMYRAPAAGANSTPPTRSIDSYTNY
jgi:hypothetical protein